MSRTSSLACAVLPRTLSRHERFRSALEQRFDRVRWNDGGRRLSGDELVQFLEDAERVVVGVEQIDARAVARLSSLQVVAKFGVGLDNLDLDALEAAGVMVGWTPGINRRAVAELALAGTLALLRGLADGDRHIRAGALSGGTWRALVGRELHEQHVGVVGCGHVGLELARLVRALGARVSVCDARDRREWLGPLDVPQIGLDELCRTADILTLHVPLDRSTRDMFDADRLALLKPGALLVNTARGELVDEQALLTALDAGRLGGAFLDVLRAEPAAPGPLVSHPLVLVSAHVGSRTVQSIEAMADAALRNLTEPAPVSALRARLAAGRIEP